MTEIENLTNLLKEEEEIYSEILKLANKKTEMIAEDNIDEIEKLAKEEEEFIKKARILEYKREDEITKIEKNLEIEKITDLSSLLENIDDEKLRENLKQTQIKFKETLEELKRVNMINNTLIKDALEYITLSLNLITGATADNTYGKDAVDESQTQRRSMFDFKG